MYFETILLQRFHQLVERLVERLNTLVFELLGDLGEADAERRQALQDEMSLLHILFNADFRSAMVAIRYLTPLQSVSFEPLLAQSTHVPMNPARHASVRDFGFTQKFRILLVFNPSPCRDRSSIGSPTD